MSAHDPRLGGTTPEVPRGPDGLYDIPPDRGRWRLSLHSRQFADQSWQTTLITEIVGARSIRLEKPWNQAAQLTLTLDGYHPTALLIEELAQDIVAWRWDDERGVDVCMFRGIIAQALDEVTEQSHTVNITCHDYLKMLERRFLTNGYYCDQRDQDNIVVDMIDRAKNVASSGGLSFVPGSYLPITVETVNPDGTPRGNSGQLRDRTYPPQSGIAEIVANLANVINGFDFDLVPAAAIAADATSDVLRIFQPYRGVVRTTPLVYGTTVSSFTRSINSANYSNYWRTLGFDPTGGSDDPTASTTQLYAEDWNADANDVDRIPFGTWMGGNNASDVSLIDTLVQQAAGNLDLYGKLDPDGKPTAAWSVILRPGIYKFDITQPGDMVPLVVRSGRLDLNTEIRILGLNFSMDENGDETVELIVGQPIASLFQLLTQADRDVDAIARREQIPTGLDAPVGAMYDWPGAVVPYSWQLADGGPLLRVDYPELFDVIGYTFGGAGDTFNKPDCRGRAIVGAGQGPGRLPRAVADLGGAETVQLLPAHMPVHNHQGGLHAHNAPAHQHNYFFSTLRIGGVASGTGSGVDAMGADTQNAFTSSAGGAATDMGGGVFTSNNGGDAAHENMQPFVALNKIIRCLPPTVAAARRRRSAA